MSGVATVGGGVLALQVRGEGPAGRHAATSRRRTIALALLLAVGAAGAGSILGLVAQPKRPDHADDLVFTAAAAVDAARRADARARSAELRVQATEKALSDAKSRIESLSAAGAPQELADAQEAERLGVARFMKDSTALWGGERRRVEAAIVRESRRNGLDPLLVAAVIQVESRFDPFAVSGVGACGLMQLMPPTAEWLLSRDLKPAHLFNPVLNIELGTLYLSQLMDQFDGDLNRALIAYNAGPSVARSLQRGSKSWKRLEQYPKAVLTAYKTLLTVPEQIAAR
jgi:soluble lytic murein transglycosylase